MRLIQWFPHEWMLVPVWSSSSANGSQSIIGLLKRNGPILSFLPFPSPPYSNVSAVLCTSSVLEGQQWLDILFSLNNYVGSRSMPKAIESLHLSPSSCGILLHGIFVIDVTFCLQRRLPSLHYVEMCTDLFISCPYRRPPLRTGIV